jgi:hypothetical protein
LGESVPMSYLRDKRLIPGNEAVFNISGRLMIADQTPTEEPPDRPTLLPEPLTS